MAQARKKDDDEFMFLYETEEDELQELRKFLDPEIDLSSLGDFSNLIHRLNHLLDKK